MRAIYGQVYVKAMRYLLAERALKFSTIAIGGPHPWASVLTDPAGIQTRINSRGAFTPSNGQRVDRVDLAIFRDLISASFTFPRVIPRVSARTRETRYAAQSNSAQLYFRE